GFKCDWSSDVCCSDLHYRSANARPKQDILGTVMLSVLAGHKRYAHITTVRSDSVLPELLSMKRVRSEDAVRRAFQHGGGGTVHRGRKSGGEGKADGGP